MFERAAHPRREIDPSSPATLLGLATARARTQDKDTTRVDAATIEHTLLGPVPPPAGASTAATEQDHAHRVAPPDTDVGDGDPAPRATIDDPSSTRIAASLPSDEPSSTRAPRLYPGATISGTRLRVDGWLGEGASAVVYRGEDVDLQRKLAIKVLRHVPDAEARERFLEEARTTARLHSPFIAEVAEFGTLADGRLYYAMRLAEGRNLAHALRDGPLPLTRVFAILRMACKAMAEAHDADIVHRDLKPANMVLERTHGKDRLIVLDFGIASRVGVQSPRLCGTPHYMAPEQIRGEMLDGRADIYALGCCAYEMLWGRPLVEGASTDDVLAGHLEPGPIDFPEPPDGPKIPPAMRAVIERCVALDRDDRYASAAELEAALCEAQISAGVRCSTDYLEPPEVDPRRREAIVTALVRRRRRGWLQRGVVAAAIAAVALTGASFAAAAHDDDVALASAQASEQIDEIEAQAIDAAEHGVFVYPLPESDRATAYATILRLERWDGVGRTRAQERAQWLRTDFATRLIAYGDHAWDDPMTRGYARDYYAQALVLDPHNGRVRDRVGMTTGELAELRHKAETEAFSAGELEAAEALVDFSHPESSDDDETDARRTRPPRSRARKVVADPAPSPDAERDDDVALDDATHRQPGTARRFVRRGRRALTRGDRARAREMFEKAIDHDPANAAAYAGLADAYFESGQHERALHFAKMAARRSPNSAEHRLRLGDSYLRVGRRARAREQYERAVALGSRVAATRVAQIGG